MAATAKGLVIAANQNPALNNVYTTYGAATPQIYLEIDRERAQPLGIKINDIFAALQTTMGGTYVNDFNRFGRTWQVNVQAEAADRKLIDDVFRVRVRNARGDLVPLPAVASDPANSSLPPRICVARSVPPPLIVAKPPLLIVVLVAAPPEFTYCAPPLSIVVLVAAPPEFTPCVPPLSAVRLAVAPE